MANARVHTAPSRYRRPSDPVSLYAHTTSPMPTPTVLAPLPPQKPWCAAPQPQFLPPCTHTPSPDSASARHRPHRQPPHNHYLHIFNTHPRTILRLLVEKSALPQRKCLHRFSLRASMRLATLPVDKSLSGRGSTCDTRSSLRPQESYLHGYSAQARLATR
jgi:hypothetical protein